MVSLFFLFLRSEFDHAIHCIHLLGKAYAQVEWDKTIWTSLDSNLVRSIRKRVMVGPHGLVRVILLTQKRSSSVTLISRHCVEIPLIFDKQQKEVICS